MGLTLNYTTTGTTNLQDGPAVAVKFTQLNQGMITLKTGFN